jgi:hypothetical protein
MSKEKHDPNKSTVFLPAKCREISELIAQQKYVEAYLRVCQGAECHPIDESFLRNTIEGLDCCQYHEIKNALMYTGDFNPSQIPANEPLANTLDNLLLSARGRDDPQKNR